MKKDAVDMFFGRVSVDRGQGRGGGDGVTGKTNEGRMKSNPQKKDNEKRDIFEEAALSVGVCAKEGRKG